MVLEIWQTVSCLYDIMLYLRPYPAGQLLSKYMSVYTGPCQEAGKNMTYLIIGQMIFYISLAKTITQRCLPGDLLPSSNAWYRRPFSYRYSSIEALKLSVILLHLSSADFCGEA